MNSQYPVYLYNKILYDLGRLKSDLVSLCVELDEPQSALGEMSGRPGYRLPKSHEHLRQVELAVRELWKVTT